MAQLQTVFERYEKKYFLDALQYSAIVGRLGGRAATDRYGLHTVCSLYYDTDRFDLIRASIEKPAYREKLRLRSYGVSKPGDIVFLELKKKYDGVVYKRRVPLEQNEAARFLDCGEKPASYCQILREIDWFIKTYRPVPKAFVACDRVCLAGITQPELRVTFDRNIRFRETELDLSKGDWGHPILDPDYMLMEIKIPGAMPLWLSRMLSDLKIFPASFSKYGACYKEHLFPKARKKGGVICA